MVTQQIGITDELAEMLVPLNSDQSTENLYEIPLDVGGLTFDGHAVVAWGNTDISDEYVDDDEIGLEGQEQWTILLLINPKVRIPNKEMYMVRVQWPYNGVHSQAGIDFEMKFPNIIPACEQYADLGMDY